MIRMGDDWSPEGYALCAAKVVEQAAQDYRRALRRLHYHPADQAAQDAKAECERFFRRDMGMYSDLDGEAIIREIKARVRREVGRR